MTASVYLTAVVGVYMNLALLVLLVLLHVAVVGIHHLLTLLGRGGNHADIVVLLGYDSVLGVIATVVHFDMIVVIDLAVFAVY